MHNALPSAAPRPVPLLALGGALSHGAERLLAEALDRALRAPRGRAVLVLHLSRLARPAPWPHHSRIAHVVLQDAAQRHDGQVFSLGNGDMALLCRRAGLAGEGPAALPAILFRLFRADASDPTRLLSVWSLEEPVDQLRAWVAERLADPAAAPAAFGAPEPPQAAPRLEAIEAALRAASLPELMRRQTAVLALPGEPGLRPLFRELASSVPAIEARLAVAGIATLDPFLFRHLAGGLDARILALLTSEIEAGSPAVAPPGGPALHLDLSLPGILSDAFAAFAAACRARGIAAGAEVALAEICADHDAFLAARERMRSAGVRLVVDEVSHLALLLTAPAALGADLLKLEWSPRLPAAPAAERAGLAEALHRIGPGRVVLQRADTERAITWGMEQGIRRFQGRQVDAMLAASRMRECPAAAACSLGQCIERAGAMAAAPRRACRSPALLDGTRPALAGDRSRWDQRGRESPGQTCAAA